MTNSNKRWKIVLFLQGIMVISSLANIFAKLASGNDFLTPHFIMYYALEILMLGIYAVLWQQAIKHTDLSVAYMNRSSVLLWSLLWAVLIFGDNITPGNVAGTVLVIAGTIVVNSDE